MSGDDDTLHRADAFMRRHRSVVTPPPPVTAPPQEEEEETPPPLPPVEEVLEDVLEDLSGEIPLLTDMVAAGEFPPAERVTGPGDSCCGPHDSCSPGPPGTDLPQQDEIEALMTAWLAETLPIAVANVSRNLLDELNAHARESLLPRLRCLLQVQRETPPET